MRKHKKPKWTQWAGCPHYCHTPCCSHIWCNRLSTMQWKRSDTKLCQGNINWQTTESVILAPITKPVEINWFCSSPCVTISTSIQQCYSSPSGQWVRYELLSLLYYRSSFVTNPRFLLLRPCARPVIWSPTNQPTATANLSPVCNGSGRSRSRGWQGLGKAGVPRCSIRLAKYPQPSCCSSDTYPPRSSDHHG